MTDKIIKYAIRIVILLTCFPIHETAHAWMAHKLGDDTGKNYGRISLNPFAHLTYTGALAMIFLGFGWGKPVPIDARNFKKPKLGFALSALAGPVSNLILAYIAICLAKIFYYLYVLKSIQLFFYFYIGFQYFMLINISLAIFNLLPIPPLDGSRILSLILPEDKYFSLMKYERYFFLALVILLFTGILDKPLQLFQNTTISTMNFLSRWVDSILKLIFIKG